MRGKQNHFFGKRHSHDTLIKMSVSKMGENNPMYGELKSSEFLYHMHRDKSGANNPMYGKPKYQETLEKLRKKVYVQDSKTYELLYEFESTVRAKTELHMGIDTLYKRLEDGKPHRGMLFSRTLLRKPS